MIYQVRANLFFEDKDEARDFYHDCILALENAVVVHPGEANQECSEISLLHCRHDEAPNHPCDEVDSRTNCPQPPD